MKQRHDKENDGGDAEQSLRDRREGVADEDSSRRPRRPPPVASAEGDPLGGFRVVSSLTAEVFTREDAADDA